MKFPIHEIIFFMFTSIECFFFWKYPCLWNIQTHLYYRAIVLSDKFPILFFVYYKIFNLEDEMIIFEIFGLWKVLSIYENSYICSCLKCTVIKCSMLWIYLGCIMRRPKSSARWAQRWRCRPSSQWTFSFTSTCTFI